MTLLSNVLLRMPLGTICGSASGSGSASTALYMLLNTRARRRERAAYERLRTAGDTEMLGFHVPQDNIAFAN